MNLFISFLWRNRQSLAPSDRHQTCSCRSCEVAASKSSAQMFLLKISAQKISSFSRFLACFCHHLSMLLYVVEHLSESITSTPFDKAFPPLFTGLKRGHLWIRSYISYHYRDTICCPGALCLYYYFHRKACLWDYETRWFVVYNFLEIALFQTRWPTYQNILHMLGGQRPEQFLLHHMLHHKMRYPTYKRKK